jgi:hypothetical protein
MKSLFMEHGTIVYGALFASAIVALLSLVGFLVVPETTEPIADMRIEPAQGHVTVGDTFAVDVVVSAQTPVNVFKGQVNFDHTILRVESIDYNTSIADLWAELPWYENGEGTVNFAGGTTQSGGFQSTGSLITITFRAYALGDTSLRLEGARILEHNGLGTDVVLTRSIDAIFEVEESIIASQTVAAPEASTVQLAVTPERPSTDLSGDGKQTIADVSIFMLHMLSEDLRYDFNADGTVDAKDLSIIMSAQ